VKVLVLNCGSSSIKYQLRDFAQEAVLADALISRIGEDPAVPDHRRALELMLEALLAPETGAVKDLAEISAVGHRTVHGGSFFTAPVLITPEVIEKMQEHAPLAPLHNPPILLGIKEALRVLPGIPQVAVFDTAFHTTIPAKAHLYALPYRFYTDSGVRRYGFHGNSFQFVSRRVTALLGERGPDSKVIIAHLGNGASIAAIRDGVSVDTSMGLTPLEGLVMGTRPGDVDPGVILYLMRELGLTENDVDRILNKESGLLGLSGVGNDMRDVLAAAGQGDERCRLALEVYAYRLRKYVGAYAAALGGLDALVFTAGIGENSPEIRAAVCEGLDFLGVELDPDRNASTRAVEADIGRVGSRVRVMVVPTDESRLIAEETMALVSAMRAG
jgi:acetate kinase